MTKKRQRTSRKTGSARAKPRTDRPRTGAPASWLRWTIPVAGIALVALWILSRPDNPNSPSSTAPPVPASALLPGTNNFVGSEGCAECHPKEYDLWKQSTHAKAGGRPSETTLIARFDGTPLRFKDAVVTPTKTAAGNPVFIVEQAGSPPAEIPVDAVVGGGHMFGGGTQSFFNQFPDGTVRFLPFDFIRQENIWFVQLRRDNTWVPVSEEISLASDLANWPPSRVLGTRTQFSNCQNCHGSQITLNYDHDLRRFQTRFTSLSINCESCHGPGRRHIELARQPNHETLTDIGMIPLATLSKDQSLNVCFQCHASKDAIREGNYLPGDDLEEFFSLKLPVIEDTFTVDGRVRSFSYQSAHLYSACYLEGSMTCVDCHDPHAQSYRGVFGEPLVGRFDDGQCTGCHASKAFDIEAHTHHKPDSDGSRCTACHMPFLQNQGVGHQLQFARSDHSIPIPRPAFDQQIGIENACQKCHADKGIAWQEAALRQWFGELKPHHPAVSNLIRLPSVSDAAEAAQLLLQPDLNHPMAQLRGLSEFVRRFLLEPTHSVEPSVVPRLMTLAQSSDLDLKAMALMALHLRCNRMPGVQEFLAAQLQSLGPRDAAVRNRWAVTASYMANAYADAGELPLAIESYLKALEISDQNVVIMSQLALACLKAGQVSETIRWLRRAIELQPDNAVLHFQLAQTHARSGEIPEAVQALQAGLQYAPHDARARSLLQQLQGR